MALRQHGPMPVNQPRPYSPLRKCRVALHGLRLAMRDTAVAYKLVLSVVLLAVAFAQRAWVDFGLLLLATALVLAAELLNTAIEELCDYVQPERAPQIGATKDIAAAGVSLCILAWVGVMALEAWRLLLSGRS
ncbi:diacylglycerol kinase [Vulcanococcus limneticus]|uniref:diacylglycerol kinase n=1 Tax=Vulcanococcus limneticus TaxID=2170428 RepID=UPI00398BC02F